LNLDGVMRTQTIILVLLPLVAVGKADSLAYADAESLPNADPIALADPEALADADADSDADAEAEAQYGRYPYNPYGQVAGGGGFNVGGDPETAGCPNVNMMDECCGMSQEGCCMGGQKCYTYYERQCENVNEPVCDMKGKKFCEKITLNDCRVVRERGTLVLSDEKCSTVNRRECFEYDKTVCAMNSKKMPEYVTWDNQKLERGEDKVEERCEEVRRCNYTTENITNTKEVPEKVCDPYETTEQVCNNVPVTKYETRLDYSIRYRRQCQTVDQPSCSSSPCSQNMGCLNGGSVCSTSEYNMTTVCPSGGMGMPVCQNVRTPVCYGNLGTCNYATQQCCTQNPQQVCQNMPVRVARNISVPVYSTEQKCRDVTRTLQNCRTEYKTQNYTISNRKCNDVTKNVCFNMTIPQYDVVREEKNETVDFSVILCERKKEKRTFCTNVPADVRCQKIPVTKQYILNKVICDRQRTVQYCRSIPESDCRNVLNQRCRQVPRQVCQPTCNQSSQCQRCEQFRSQGGFSSCNSGRCGNFYPEDESFNTTYGGGEAYYPNDNTYIGGNGFNPGVIVDNNGFNPGYDGEDIYGDDGFNPGYNGGSGYNPGFPDYGGNGGGGFNPGYPDINGNSGYNPGFPDINGGSGYNPGFPDYNGGGGYNPGLPDYNINGGGGFNPGFSDFNGGNEYNPGFNTGGGGFNPGYNGGGNGGFNPGFIDNSGGGFVSGRADQPPALAATVQVQDKLASEANIQSSDDAEVLNSEV
jgi:hypothetical protein